MTWPSEKYGFRKGDRVRLSQVGKAALTRYHNLRGVVVGFGADDRYPVVHVQPDHVRSRAAFAARFVELDDSLTPLALSPADDGGAR